jgi:hypothetical protein
MVNLPETGIALKEKPQRKASFSWLFNSKVSLLKRLRGGCLLGLGYLLSPLSWWNDIFFNLPVAYFFGYVCSLFSRDLLIPCSIAGYWLSNVIGILLMQAGALDMVQDSATPRNFKKELLMGIGSSTIYTVGILVLIHFKVLTTPNLSADDLFSHLRSFLPGWIEF